MNPFAWGVVVMEVCAGGYYFMLNKPVSGTLWILYGLTNICLIVLSYKEL